MLRILLALFLLIPLPVFADHVPTQPAYGQNLTTDNAAGTITIGILGSDGFEDSPPENYTIFFSTSSGVTETNSFCVTTSFGHQDNTWQYYTFSNDDLKYYFDDLAGVNFYFRIRSNNETDNLVSTLTNEVSYNIYAGVSFEFNQTDWSAPTGTDACNPYVVTTTTTTTTTTTIPPAVPDDATNVSVNYQGKDVYFAWEYTDGNTLVNEFHINYSYDNAKWDRVIITDTAARTYTLDYTNIQTGTFYWTFSVCGDIENGESCTDSDSNNFETTQYVAPTTTVYVEPPPPPPPPPPTPEEIIVDEKVEGVDKTYTQADVNDGTLDRDKERVANEEEFGCFMTDAQIERGDCAIPEPIEEDIKNDIIEEEVIVEEIKEDVEVIIPEDDVVVLDPPQEEISKDEVVEFEEQPIEFEIIEFDLEDIVTEIVDDVPIQDETIEEIVDEEIKEDTKEVLDEPIQEIIEEDVDREILEAEVKEPVELTKEEIAVEAEEVTAVVENIVVEEVTTEEAIEIIEQVNDIGVQELDQVSVEVQEVVQAVVEEAIADVEELTEEQVEVVAEVLQVATADVAIIAESVKDDEVIAEAVEEYVARAVANTDVENYTLADVVTEISYESFIENPIETFVDFDNLGEITIANIGDDMTNDQKEKAQEVVVPVILTRIASMAAFIFRRS